MKRLYISIALLLAVLSGGIWSAVYIERSNDKIQYLGEQIREEALRDEDASNEIAELCAFWEKHSRVLAFIENTGGISSVSAEMSRLPALADAGSPDLVQQIDVVCAQCDLLAERHQLHLRSLL